MLCLPNKCSTRRHDVTLLASSSSPVVPLNDDTIKSALSVNNNNNNKHGTDLAAPFCSERQSKIMQIVSFLTKLEHCFLYLSFTKAPQIECKLCCEEFNKEDLCKYCVTEHCDSFVCKLCSSKLKAKARMSPSDKLCPWCRVEHTPPVLDYSADNYQNYNYSSSSSSSNSSTYNSDDDYLDYEMYSNSSDGD
jgi:hypothetical protein